MKSVLLSSPRQLTASRISRVRVAVGEELAESPDGLREAEYFKARVPRLVGEPKPVAAVIPREMIPCTIPPDERTARETIAGSENVS